MTIQKNITIVSIYSMAPKTPLTTAHRTTGWKTLSHENPTNKYQHSVYIHTLRPERMVFVKWQRQPDWHAFEMFVRPASLVSHHIHIHIASIMIACIHRAGRAPLACLCLFARHSHYAVRQPSTQNTCAARARTGPHAWREKCAQRRKGFGGSRWVFPCPCPTWATRQDTRSIRSFRIEKLADVRRTIWL